MEEILFCIILIIEKLITTIIMNQFMRFVQTNYL